MAAVALALFALQAAAQQPDAPPPAALALKITGVLFDGLGEGDPEPEECIRIENTGVVPVDLSGVVLTDRHGPSRLGRRNSGERELRFPPDAQARPDQEIWVAHRGDAFQRIFGRPPDYEAVNTLDAVPEVIAPEGWLNLPSTRGAVALVDKAGVVVDLVAYEKQSARLDQARLPSGAWRGAPVQLDRASLLGWKGQILARDRTVGGGVQPDTDSAEDWNSGFTATRLGADPIRRVEYPGQTRFAPWPIQAQDAEIVAASAPDNQFQVLAQALDAASEEIRIRIYQFENDHIADRLVAALERGVKVTVFLEGSPVGGIPDQERWITSRLEKAGAKIWFLVSDPKRKIRARYKFDHSKYALIDRDRVMIATENFGYTGFPVDPTFGNRGWAVFIREPRLYRALSAVWDADLVPGLPDILAQDDDSEDVYGLPYKDAGFTVFRAVRTGSYPGAVPPLRTRGAAGLELVLCPDNCLSEETGVIGLIKSARKTLEITQNSVPLWWGPKHGGSMERTPNLPLMAAIEAARRGVRTRILLDGTWYNVEDHDPRDNEDTVAALERLARKEKLPLAAKVVNLAAADIEKIHAKGVIADGTRVLVGSMNWTESSFKANREVAVVVDQPEVGRYYQALFERDWIATRLYGVTVAKGGVRVREAPASTAKVLRRYPAGDVLDVVGELGDALEVRLNERQTGWIDRAAVGEVILAAENTRSAVGKVAAVSGRVTSVHLDARFAALNFGPDWRLDFSAYLPLKIFQALVAKVGSAEALEGRMVTVRGKVVEKNGPAIQVSTLAQVQLR